MEKIQLNLCECCALVVANGDDTASTSHCNKVLLLNQDSRKMAAVRSPALGSR